MKDINGYYNIQSSKDCIYCLEQIPPTKRVKSLKKYINEHEQLLQSKWGNSIYAVGPAYNDLTEYTKWPEEVVLYSKINFENNIKDNILFRCIDIKQLIKKHKIEKVKEIVNV